MVTSHGIYEYDMTNSCFTCHDPGVEICSKFFITASRYKIYIMSCNAKDKSAFAFDVVTKKSARLCDMLNTWNDGFAVWYDSKIYTFLFMSGFRGRDYCNERKVECYDPGMDSWGAVDGFEVPPSTLNARVFDKLYVFTRGNMWKENYELIDLEELKAPNMSVTARRCFFASV